MRKTCKGGMINNMIRNNRFIISMVACFIMLMSSPLITCAANEDDYCEKETIFGETGELEDIPAVVVTEKIEKSPFYRITPYSATQKTVSREYSVSVYGDSVGVSAKYRITVSFSYGAPDGVVRIQSGYTAITYQDVNSKYYATLSSQVKRNGNPAYLIGGVDIRYRTNNTIYKTYNKQVKCQNTGNVEWGDPK